MNDICQFVCPYRTPSGYCGSTGGYATCQRRKMDEPPTIKSAEPMTNADKIRQMSDDVDLAQEIWSCRVFDGFQTLLNWLKQEVE